MLEEAVEFVRKNSRTKTIINENGQRADKPEYPIKAVREAILNALVHRDYSIHTENVPIRIEMYRDRMEIINSGGLYGRISIDALGKVRPETRNAALPLPLGELSPQVTERVKPCAKSLSSAFCSKRLSEQETVKVSDGFSLQVEQDMGGVLFSDFHVVGENVLLTGIFEGERFQIGDGLQPGEGHMKLIDRVDGYFGHSVSFPPRNYACGCCACAV